MSIQRWLQARAPKAPPTLARRLGEAVGASAEDADVHDTLVAACEHTLREVLDRGDAGRDSALDLLTADALATYAFEAAADDPATLTARARDTMRRLAAAGAEPRVGD